MCVGCCDEYVHISIVVDDLIQDLQVNIYLCQQQIFTLTKIVTNPFKKKKKKGFIKYVRNVQNEI